MTEPPQGSSEGPHHTSAGATPLVNVHAVNLELTETCAHPAPFPLNEWRGFVLHQPRPLLGGQQGALPHNVDAEQSLLAAMLQFPKTVIPNVIARGLMPAHCYVPAHRIIFNALVEVFSVQQDVSLLSLTEFLREVGQLEQAAGTMDGQSGPGGWYLTRLYSATTGSAILTDAVQIVEERAARRQLAELSEGLKRRVLDPHVDTGSLIEEFKVRANRLALMGQNRRGCLTVRKLSELLAMTFDDTDNFFGDRTIAAGQPCTLLGPGGVGKSRLSLQLAICMITGRDFLGLPTYAANKTWLFIQTENNNRRLKHDLANICRSLRLTDDEVRRVNDHLFIHTIETDTDAFINLINPDNYANIHALIQSIDPTFVVFDPLNALTDADLNTDKDMRAVVTAISQVTRAGNPNRVPLVLHHSLTGRAGAARAVGWDKTSYGRNSKVLQAWTRSQINLAPRSPDNSDLLIMSCGKNNNGRLFPEIGIIFDEAAGIYREDEDFDPVQFREDVGVVIVRKKPISPDEVADLVGDGLQKAKLVTAIRATYDVSKATAYRAIDRAAVKGAISKDAGNVDAIYFSRERDSGSGRKLRNFGLLTTVS